MAIETRLGISVAPSDVRLIPGPQDPYKWSYPPQKRHLFKKQLSKHCIQAYKEIYAELDDFIEAIPAEASFSEAGHSVTAANAPPEGLCDFEATTRPAKSFTARIDELTDGNVEMEVELER